MWARKRIDIGWSDLAAGLGSLFDHSTPELAKAVEHHWAANTLACLSVRTALDLTLQALQLPGGSEVLVSAITIPDMVAVIQEHGLVPIPIDLCADDLSVDIDSLATAITDRTRLVLVAHLFGPTMPMQPIVDIADQHGLLIFEDCAQAFAGENTKGHPDSDFVAFSFGPIKTATALGGGLIAVRDMQTLRRMREIHTDYPIQTRWNFGKRVLKYGVLKLLGTWFGFRILTWVCRLVRRDIDRAVGAAAKNFPADQLVKQLRRQPAAALLALLRRRLTQFDSARLRARAQSGHYLRQVLSPSVRCVGPVDSTHWVFAVRSHQPRALVGALRRVGFDATTVSSLRVLTPLAANAIRPLVAESLLPELVFVPAYPEMPKPELERMAEVINNFETSIGSVERTLSPTRRLLPKAQHD